MERKEINIWWGPPRPLDLSIENRKVSWLELFYDLVYVAAISQITHHLSMHISWLQLGIFYLLFSGILWSWLNGALYHDLHGNAGIRTRMQTLFQMMVVAVMAATIHELYAGQKENFAVTICILQALLTYLWWSVGFYDPRHKNLNRPYSITYGISLVLMLISVFVSFQLASILWIIALCLNLGVLFISGPVLLKEFNKLGIKYTTSTSIIERFGLFAIIVLGENILGIVNGVKDIEIHYPYMWLIFLLGIIIVFAMWWIYFDMTSERLVRDNYWTFVRYVFINLFLLGTFASAGAAVNNIIAGNLHSHLAIWIFGLGICVILFCIILLTGTMQLESNAKTIMRNFLHLIWATILAIAILTACNSFISVLTFMIFLCIILTVPIYIGSRIWVRYKMLNETE